jgi:hypothetical protein
MNNIQLLSHAVDFTGQSPVSAYAPAGKKSGATCDTIEIADRNAMIYEGGCDDNCKLSQAITGYRTPAMGAGRTRDFAALKGCGGAPPFGSS